MNIKVNFVKKINVHTLNIKIFFFAASSPTAKPYVEVGSKVKAGQVLCIVEAMKVMNEIKAPIDGTVTSIMANSEDLVEYDQVLMIIEG